MKNLKKIMAAVLAVMMISAMAVGAISSFAAGDTPSITIKPNKPDNLVNGSGTTITYTYYKILTADIDTDPIVNSGTGETTNLTGSGSAKVAYYVTNSAQAAAIEGLKTSDNKAIFNVTRVGDTDKWYVELNKETSASAEDIVAAFNNDTFLANFTKQEYTSTGGDATLPGVSAGYYFIKSSLGSKMAVQTLAPVTINEKNEYVSDNKTIPEVDKNSQIGQEITYTLTVNVPPTANDQIVLTDTMSKGLTFKEIKSMNLSGSYGPVTDGASGSTQLVITYTKEQIENWVSGSTANKPITIEVTVIVNEDAAIDTDIPNTLDLKYGNNYDAVPVTVNTKTTKFEFDKVDGTDSGTKLTGAEFQLLLNNNVIKLVELVAGKTYRVATADEITEAGDTLKDTIVTNGNTITINGLDGDLTYKLKETKAPTGYNLMDPDTKDVVPSSGTFVKINVENNKGSVLPSTGGIGTTIFYVVGAVLVIGSGIVLVTKKRMGKEEN